MRIKQTEIQTTLYLSRIKEWEKDMMTEDRVTMGLVWDSSETHCSL